MLTIISLATDTTKENLEKTFKDIDKWNDELKELFKMSTHFRFLDNELLIYNERKMLASCCYLDSFKHDKIEITSAWTEQGQVYKAERTKRSL